MSFEARSVDTALRYNLAKIYRQKINFKSLHIGKNNEKHFKFRYIQIMFRGVLIFQSGEPTLQKFKVRTDDNFLGKPPILFVLRSIS